MSRFTDPMILAREPGAPEAPVAIGPVTEEEFWARLEAKGIKVTRAKREDNASSQQAAL